MSMFLTPRAPVQLSFEYELWTPHYQKLHDDIYIIERIKEHAADYTQEVLQRDHMPMGYHAPYVGPHYCPEIQSPIGSLSALSRTLPAFYRAWNWDEHVNAVGWGADNPGGIHVNVNSTPFVRKLAPKVYQFMSRYRRQLFACSGRTQFSWQQNCQVASTVTNTVPSTYFNILSSRKVISPNRLGDTPKERAYLNERRFRSSGLGELGWGPYEMRMFTALPELIPVSLQWTDAMFNMARDIETPTWDNFRNYLRSSPKYINAYRHLTAHELRED